MAISVIAAPPESLHRDLETIAKPNRVGQMPSIHTELGITSPWWLMNQRHPRIWSREGHISLLDFEVVRTSEVVLDTSTANRRERRQRSAIVAIAGPSDEDPSVAFLTRLRIADA